ncbi:hypothetical protein BS78_01G125600 [Paspalum vaginatum]|nr:hypothetical protein BS78_01G125600 [Paspalum vaginatum]
MACDSGNLRRVKAMVDSLDQDDRESLASVRMEGIGALHAATMKGKVEICRYLVEVLKFDVNSVDTPESGGTPLIFAALDGQVAAARYLLDKGADPNKQDHQGCAPLHEAAKEGYDEIAQLLLSRGAIVDIASSEGTPLHAAAVYGKTGIMQILLEHHADVSDKDIKVQLKSHDEKTVKKQGAGSSKTCPDDKASGKGRKAQLKL